MDYNEKMKHFKNAVHIKGTSAIYFPNSGNPVYVYDIKNIPDDYVELPPIYFFKSYNQANTFKIVNELYNYEVMIINIHDKYMLQRVRNR